MVCASARAVICPTIPWWGWGELSVGVVPEIAGVGVQADLPGGLGVLERRGEQPGEAGVGERVVVAAFGQQAPAAAGDEEDAVQVAVGELCLGGVAAQFVLGDVADQRNVRAGGARGTGAGQDRQRSSVPSGAQRRRESRDLAGGGLQDAGELGLDHQQSLVADAGVLGGRVAYCPDQPLAVI
jgi:hypothetical protein